MFRWSQMKAGDEAGSSDLSIHCVLAHKDLLSKGCWPVSHGLACLDVQYDTRHSNLGITYHYPESKSAREEL